MKIKRFVLLGAIILFLLVIFGSMNTTAQPDNPPPTTVIVTQGEGAEFSDMGTGEEPPVRVVLIDFDGNIRLVGYWAHVE